MDPRKEMSLHFGPCLPCTGFGSESLYSPQPDGPRHMALAPQARLSRMAALVRRRGPNGPAPRSRAGSAAWDASFPAGSGIFGNRQAWRQPGSAW